MKITREWIALCISALALAVSGSSAFYSFKADQRAEESALPAVEWSVNQQDRRNNQVSIRIRNITNIRIDIVGVDIYEPKGARIEVAAVDDIEDPKAPLRATGKGATGVAYGLPVEPGNARRLNFLVFLPEAVPVQDNIRLDIRLRVEVGNRNRRQEVFTYTGM